MRVSTHIKVKHPHNGTKVFFKGFNRIDPSVPNALQKLDVHNDLIKKKKKKPTVHVNKPRIFLFLTVPEELKCLTSLEEPGSEIISPGFGGLQSFTGGSTLLC